MQNHKENLYVPENRKNGVFSAPKFVLSKKKAIEQYNKVKKLADIASYSSKTNQDVAKVLEKETDSLFSVHFINELKHLKDMSRVIFLAQAWTQKGIKELIDKGINYFVVDNESDLDELIKFLKHNNTKVNLLLRLRLKEHTIKTEKYFVFGMFAETINKRIKELKDNKNIKSLGVHFHRKTQNMSEWDLKYELSNILNKKSLETIDTINIGGGLPSEYANTNIDVINSVFNKITELRIWLKENNIKLIIEPGRFIAAPAVKLVTKIVAIYENTIIVNASVYNTDMDALVVPVKLLIEGEQKNGTPYIVKGSTPCSL
ncbi:MAG: decarboxylase, partial [Nanoarchaeota archaeon]|nr:decarboxylase [Nanoarchaeota archaeon]